MKVAALRLCSTAAGLPPETIALSVAVGLVLGVFPVFGCPTLLCAAAAFVLRLNLPALQLINQLSSPLQLALLIPLGRFGAFVIGDRATWSLVSVARNAILGWFCLCLPLGLLLYYSLLFTLRRSRREWSNGVESSA